MGFDNAEEKKTIENNIQTGNLNKERDSKSPPDQRVGNVLRKKTKKVIITVLVLVFILIGIIAGTVVYSNAPEKKLNRQLSLGERYLTEMQYEEAIAAFRQVVEIDPLNPEGYKGIAEVYVQKKDYKNALSTLNVGYEQTQNYGLHVCEVDICLMAAGTLEEESKIDDAIEILAIGFEDTGEPVLEYEKKRLEGEKEVYIEIANEETESIKEDKPEEQEDPAVVRERLLDEVGEGYEAGMLLPDFVFYDLEGNTVHITDYLGKKVYIDFITTWCPWSYSEIPEVEITRKKYDDEELEILLLDIQEEKEEIVQYCDQFGVTLPVYRIENWDMGDYHIYSIPFSIALDEYGRIFKFGGVGIEYTVDSMFGKHEL